MRRFCLALLLGCALAASARAGGFGIPEIGVRRTAMGSIIGRPDDPSAIYHNPAGLVLQHGWQLYASFGLSLLDTELRLAPWDQSDRFLGVSPEADGYYATVRPRRAFGVIPMIAATAEILPGRLVVGAALYVGNATGAAFRESATTRYHLIDAYVVAPQAMASAAYQLGETISLGASLGAVNVRVHEKRDIFPIVTLNGTPTDISFLGGTRPELVLDGSGWAPAWMIGVFGRPHPRVTWGATVTGKIETTLSGPVTVTYSDDAAVPNLKTEGTQTMKQLLPWAFMAGGNVDVTPQVEVGGELRYWLYRQYKEQVTELEDLPLTEIRSPKGYHDSWEVSGGVRVHDLAAAPALELMAGTQYDHSPAPSRTVALDQPSFTHWGLHTGLRYRVGRYRLGASYIHYWYEIPTITDSITAPPSNVRGEGGNNIFTASIEAQLGRP
ncbi:MAG TPA: outer membrane protein transport protein [Kofleriaceae bacterium]|nr:outer membrane protein transport protein [Kofleriaceae bacterium]